MPNPPQSPGSLSNLVLAVLAEAPLHGYAIAREIERRTDDALSFGEGTLYPALRTLERDGFIVGKWDKEGEVGRPRKVYELTPEGIEQLKRVREEWYAYALSIDRLMRPEPRTA